MKQVFFASAILLGCLLTSCTDSQTSPNIESSEKLIGDLKLLETSSAKTVLSVALKSEGGNAIALDKVKPNSKYIITVDGREQTEIVIRNQEGFEIIDREINGNQINYFVKTNDLTLDKLYLSLVPVVKENGKWKKQNVQGFLLPSH